MARHSVFLSGSQKKQDSQCSPGGDKVFLMSKGRRRPSRSRAKTFFPSLGCQVPGPMGPINNSAQTFLDFLSSASTHFLHGNTCSSLPGESSGLRRVYEVASASGARSTHPSIEWRDSTNTFSSRVSRWSHCRQSFRSYNQETG